MFAIELYSFLLVTVTDRIILRRYAHILPYIKSTEHQNTTPNENMMRKLSNRLHLKYEQFQEIFTTCAL